MPLHLQKAYEYLGYKAGDFPVSEMVAPEILSLPMFPQLTAEQQVQVVKTLPDFLTTIVQAEHKFKYAEVAN